MMKNVLQRLCKQRHSKSGSTLKIQCINEIWESFFFGCCLLLFLISIFIKENCFRIIWSKNVEFNMAFQTDTEREKQIFENKQKCGAKTIWRCSSRLTNLVVCWNVKKKIGKFCKDLERCINVAINWIDRGKATNSLKQKYFKG